MKRLKTIINIIIWTLVAIYIAVITLTNIPAVQTFIGKEIAGVGERQGYSAMGQGASGNDEEKRREERGERREICLYKQGLGVEDW